MTTRNGRGSAGGIASIHGMPPDLPDDGRPYTVVTTTTHQKKMGNTEMSDTAALNANDFENSVWNIYVQTPKGFEFAEKLNGRPYDADIRDLFGPGVYRSIPIGPDGRPVEQFAAMHKIMDPNVAMGVGSAAKSSAAKATEAATDAAADAKKKETAGGDDWKGSEAMPSWMRYQLQHAAEERAEARRRADEAETRKEEWERTMREREWQRQENEARMERERRDREERERKEKMEREERERKEREERDRQERLDREKAEREERDRKDREERERREREDRERREREDREREYRLDQERKEAEERRFRSEQLTAIMTNATSLIGSFLESRHSRDDGASRTSRDMNELLLQAVVSNKGKEQTSIADQIEILLALDQLRKGGEKEEKEEEDGTDKMMKMAMTMLPALGALRGGGAAQQAPQAADPSDMIAQVLQDPNAVASIAMRNPKAIAGSLAKAVQNNPVLKQAVIEAFDGME